MTTYHVEYGIAGIGPVAADTDGWEAYSLDTVGDAVSLLERIREEIEHIQQSEMDAARAFAEIGDYESAWKTRERVDKMDTLYANFNPCRRNAPIYKDFPERWLSEMRDVVGFGMNLDFSFSATGEPTRRLYVWICDDCADHMIEDEQPI